MLILSNIVRKYGGVRFETRYSDHQFRKGGSKGVGGMDLEIIILSEVSQKEKDKYHILSRICGI